MRLHWSSYAERINLTVRESLARFIRKRINLSKTIKMPRRLLIYSKRDITLQNLKNL